METKKAYGVVTALGTSLGERARDAPTLLEDVRATETPDELRALLPRVLEGAKSAPLLPGFLDLLTDAEWKVWRSRLLLQAKMVRDGGKPAPGHERRGP